MVECLCDMLPAPFIFYSCKCPGLLAFCVFDLHRFAGKSLLPSFFRHAGQYTYIVLQYSPYSLSFVFFCRFPCYSEGKFEIFTFCCCGFQQKVDAIITI